MLRVGLFVCGFLAGICLLAVESRADENDVQASFRKAGKLYEEKKYAEAVVEFERALRLSEQEFGQDTLLTTGMRDQLAFSYLRLGKYEEAETHYKRSLRIYQRFHGSDHPEVAAALNRLAYLYEYQKKYAEAEPHYRRSLGILDSRPGMDSVTDVALEELVWSLTRVLEAQKKYGEAEPFLRRLLKLQEKNYGPEDTLVGLTLDNLAALTANQNRHAEAELLYRRSLRIYEKAHGPDHPNVAFVLRQLGWVCRSQEKFTDAEPFFTRALRIYEKLPGKDYEVADSLFGLAEVSKARENYAEAVSLFHRALTLYEKVQGPDHPLVADGRKELAALREAQKKSAQASNPQVAGVSGSGNQPVLPGRSNMAPNPQATTEPVALGRADLRVTLPADAVLVIGQSATGLRGAVRLFESPPIPVGKEYVYELTATWGQGCHARKVVRVAVVRAGEETAVDFTKP